MTMMHTRSSLLLFCLVWFASFSFAQTSPSLSIPGLVLKDVPFNATLSDLPAPEKATDFIDIQMSSSQQVFHYPQNNNIEIKDVRLHSLGRTSISATIQMAGHAEPITLTASTSVFPGWISVLPPLIAIILGFLTKQVLLSLFVGIWTGALLLSAFNPLTSFLKVFDTYLLLALADKGHASIILFTLLIGAVTSLIHLNGGTEGVVRWFVGWAKSAKTVQLTSWFMGLMIFFDDYANTLIVGKTMRPLTDRFRVSREKLAFIVDATAAPVASLALISTWISTEVGLIGDAISQLPIADGAYALFLSSLPYRFYPWVMIGVVFYVIWSGRDLEPMARAERTARAQTKQADGKHVGSDEDLEQPEANVPRRAFNAVIPLLVLVVGTALGLWITGKQATQGQNPPLREIIGNADAYQAMLWSTGLSLISAIILTLAQRLMTMSACFNTVISGFKSMVTACAVLVLAWSLGQMTRDLHTNYFLMEILSGALSPQWVPALTFITGAIISFATGTSWGTMSILMPLAIPLSYSLAVGGGLSPEAIHANLVSTIGSVLAGAIFGDHCSPISDTTVMSSIGTDCDLMDHVKTQLPYAILVAIVATLLGDLLSAYGFIHPVICLMLSLACCIGFIRVFGKQLPT